MSKTRKKKRAKKKVAIWMTTPEGQAWLAEKIRTKDEVKAKERDRQDIAEMKQLGLHVECSKCLHGIGHHCDLNLPDGCTDYFEVHTLRRIKP